MKPLSDLHCEACDINAKCLEPTEVVSLLSHLDGWEVIDESGIQKLKRKFLTKNYTQTMLLVNEVAKLAESANHHPQLIVDYSSLTVVWWSHKIKGLHKNDFIMAAKTSALS